MNAYSEKAKDLFRQGYNCSQAVFATFADELGIDFDTALKISSSFGGGMGRLREVCGTVSAMFLIAGIKYGYTSPTNQVAKTEHYKRIQELAETFKIKNNSIVCRELLGLDKADMKNIGYVPEIRNDQYYKKRPCVELVGDAAEIIGKYIEENKMYA